MQLDAIAHADERQRHLDASYEAVEGAFDLLQRAALDAFAGNYDAELPIPNGALPNGLSRTEPAWERFSDFVSMDRQHTHTILNALNHAARSADPAVRLPAQALLAAAAKQYADYYADEYAAECM